jgi:hypothetical protein
MNDTKDKERDCRLAVPLLRNYLKKIRGKSTSSLSK